MERFRSSLGETVYLEGILVSAEPKMVKAEPTASTIRIQNKETQLQVILWNIPAEQLGLLLGKVVGLSPTVGVWNDQIQLTYGGLELPTLLDVPPEDMVYTPESHYDDLYTLESILHSLDDSRECVKITKYLFANYSEQFMESTAAVRVHHNYRGGLLEHTLEVVSITEKAAQAIAERNPGYVDTVLAVCGALMHDFGKIFEYQFENFAPTISVEGKTSSHLYSGAALVQEAAARLGIPRDNSDLLKLINIIQSHHGSKENGSLADPMTLEAYLVSMSDNLSAQSQVFARLKKDVVGEKTVTGIIGRKKITILV